MKLFDKRPLSLILCIVLGIFVFTAFLNVYFSIVCLSISILLLGLCLIKPNIFGNLTQLLKYISIFCIPVIIYTAFYFSYYSNIEKRFGNDELTIKGRIEYLDTDPGNYSNKFIIKTTSINDKLLSKYTLVGWLDDEMSQYVDEGSEIVLNAKIDNLSNESNDYFSNDYFGIIDEITKIEVISNNKFSVESAIKNYRQGLTRSIVLLSKDKNSGGLLAALLLGEKRYISSKLQLDFTRTGTTHILALSGMHLALISLAVGKILSLCGFSKNPRVACTAIFAFLYMALTGFSPSVTRAGIMVILSSILFLLSTTHDSITSLFISCTAICIIDPSSVFDLGLWLSALATLGVIVAYEISSDKNDNIGFFKSIVKLITVSIVSSLFAIASTMLISNLAFEKISIISPVATLIFNFLCEVYIFIGLGLIVFSFVFGTPLFLEELYIFISSGLNVFSNIKGIYVSTSFPAVIILTVVLTAVIIVFFTFDIRHKKSATLIISLLVISVFVAAFVQTNAINNKDKIIYSSASGDDLVYISAEGKQILIDSNTYRPITAYNVIDTLDINHVNYLDAYILTSYYKGTSNMLDVLLSRVKVDNLYIPKPMNSQEETIYKQIDELLHNFNINLVTLESGKEIEICSIHFIQKLRTPYDEEVQKCSYSFDLKGKRYLYLSSGMFDKNTRHHAERFMNGCDSIILGAHGNLYLDEVNFGYAVNRLDNLIINSENTVLRDYYVDFYNKQGTKVHIEPDCVDILN